MMRVTCFLVFLVEAAVPKQRVGRHVDRPEWVAQVMPHDADEHLPELGDRTQLALALRETRLGGLRLFRQLLRPNRCA